MKLALLILASSAFIVGTEILKRKFSLSATFTRRIVHIGTTTVAGIAPFFVTKEEIIFVSIIFAIVILLGRPFRLFSAIHSVGRTTFGDVYLPLGVIVTALIFLPYELKAFQFGVFIMGISDALAGMVGEKFGKHHIQFFDNKKSLEGSLVFFESSLVLTFLFFPTLGYQLVLIPLVLTFAEFSFVYGLDNLILPILGAFLARGLL
jgi:phytol kinase